VVGFLKALGVPDEAAHSDAEGIEHHVSGETLAAFERFLRRRARQPAAAAGRKPAPRGRARDAEFVIETRRRIL
jgi:Mn-dependent DtxR family transcriptional regulator